MKLIGGVSLFDSMKVEGERKADISEENLNKALNQSDKNVFLIE